MKLYAPSLRDIRARAEDAFAQSKGDGLRFQTRVGPQHWPQPTHAVVVAEANLLFLTHADHTQLEILFRPK